VIPRQRLVLTVLGGTAVATAVAARLEPELGQNLEAALPQPVSGGWAARAWHDPRRRLGGVICFGADGTPHAVPVSMWPPWGRDMATMLAFRPSAMPLRRAWRQVFAILGIEAGSMSGRPSRAVAVVLAIVFGYVGAHWFYLGNRRRGWTYVVLLPLAAASVFCAIYDALRFVWVDRATFDSRFVGKPQP
jgi:TM2 domain-containing membrane protein YozV